VICEAWTKDRSIFKIDPHQLIPGPHTYTTVYNRFNRWSRQGVWTGIFKALTGHTGIWTGDAAIDSTSVKAHRSAAGAKGGPSSRA
jgi:transposase